MQYWLQNRRTNFALYWLPVIPLETMQHWMINEVISDCVWFPTSRANLTKKIGELICSLSSKWFIHWRTLEMCNNHPVSTGLAVQFCVIDWIVSISEIVCMYKNTCFAIIMFWELMHIKITEDLNLKLSPSIYYNILYRIVLVLLWQRRCKSCTLNDTDVIQIKTKFVMYNAL